MPLYTVTQAGGTSGQVQFNNSSSFGGAAGFTYQSGASPNVTIQAQNAAYIPLVVKGAASQSADVIQWQKSDGTVLAKIGSAGYIYTTQYGFTGSTFGGFWLGQINLPSSTGANYINFYNTSPGSYSVLSIQGSSSYPYSTVGYGLHWAPTANILTIGHGSIRSGTTFPIITHTATASTATLTTTSGSGVDCAGSDIYMLGGVGTGAGTPGKTIIQVSSAGVSSSTLQTPANVLTVAGVTQNVLINSTAAAIIPLVVKGAASQSGNLQEWQDSSSNVLASQSSTIFTTGNLSTTGQIRCKAPVGTVVSNFVAIGTCSFLNGFTGLFEFYQGQTPQFIWSAGVGGITPRTGDPNSQYAPRPYMALSSFNSYWTASGAGQYVTLSLGNGIGTQFSANVNYPAGFPFFTPGSSIPDNGLIVGTSGIGGSTTNLQGGYLSLCGGVSTGNATPGELRFLTTTVGSSGTALQTPLTVVTISGVTQNVLINSSAAAIIPLVVKGAASQTADLQQWQNSTGTVLSYVYSDGRFNIGGNFIINGGPGVGGTILSLNTFYSTEAHLQGYGWHFVTLGNARRVTINAVNDISVQMVIGGRFGWTNSSSDSRGSMDTAIGRNAAGVVEVNNGTLGTYRDLIARNVTATNAVTAPTIQSAALLLSLAW